MSLCLVYGTRPEAIKIGPVVAECRRRGLPHEVLCSGQHTTLLKGTPAETDLADGVSLGLARTGGLWHYERTLERWLRERWAKQRPQWVVVQGDTVTAYAATVAADLEQIPIAHIEAGVRSHNLREPYPEEIYRTEIDSVASVCYAPTDTCLDHLTAEGRSGVVTGNTVVSALARYTEAKPVTSPEKRFLVTLHRRELYTKPDQLQAIVTALNKTAASYPSYQFLWPVHPATKTVVQGVSAPNLELVEPLPYGTFALTLASSTGVLTDSGGVQEEAATLGVPCAVLRNVTDRPEAVEAGVARLYSTQPKDIPLAVDHLLYSMRRAPTSCYGCPDAASIIVDDLTTRLS